jgi:hypothetical protein
MSSTFKETKNGLYAIKLPDDIKQILKKSLVYSYLNSIGTDYEKALILETVIALDKENIKLRKSEMFLLFSFEIMAPIEESTQNFIRAFLNLDEVIRKLADKNRVQYQGGLIGTTIS